MIRPADGGSKKVSMSPLSTEKDRRRSHTCFDLLAFGTPGLAAAPAAGTRDKGTPRGHLLLLLLLYRGSSFFSRSIGTHYVCLLIPVAMSSRSSTTTAAACSWVSVFRTIRLSWFNGWMIHVMRSTCVCVCVFCDSGQESACCSLNNCTSK